MSKRTKVVVFLAALVFVGCVDGQDPLAIPYCTAPDTVAVGDSIPMLTACYPSPIVTTTKGG